MSDRPMTPAEQGRDYERVNGASDRARAQEVRQYGPDGYKGDPGANAAERRADAMGDATMQRLDPPIANGWTRSEAFAMDRHISAKAGNAAVQSEPSNAEYRLAERASDPTNRMHDAGRERAANNYKPTQAARDAARTRTSAAASTPATQNAQRQNEPDRACGVSPE